MQNKWESEVLQGNYVAGYCLLSEAISIDNEGAFGVIGTINRCSPSLCQGESSNFVCAPLLLQAPLVKAGVILVWTTVNAFECK